MWKKLKIAGKIWFSLSILIVGYFITMFVGFTNGKSSEVSLLNIADHLFPASQKSITASNSFSEQIKFYNDAVMLEEIESIDAAKDIANICIQNINEIKNIPDLPENLIATTDNLHTDLTSFTETAQTIYRAFCAGNPEKDDNLNKKMQKLGNETQSLKIRFKTLSVSFSKELKAELNKLRDISKKQRYMNIILFLIVVTLGLIAITLVIKKSISKPLQNTVLMLKDIAEGEGDLTKKLDVNSSDEIGELSKWFNNFITNLKGIISNIAENANTLNNSSADLSKLSEFMSGSANEISEKSNAVADSAGNMTHNMQAVSGSMEEASKNTNMVASATEEMTSTINEIAKNSEKARSISENAVKQAKTTTKRIEELGTAAKQVGKVTETITEISEQTNLLALNATIEAARAGDAGKGFAVVANEIKELAKQTAEATQNIKNNIEGIQTSTSGSVDDIEKISKIIDEVFEIVSIIATAVEEQSAVTNEIAGNVGQISSGIGEATEKATASFNVSEQITEEISHVNSGVNEIANSSSQITDNSQKLSDLAAQLDSLVGKFKF